MAVNTAGRVPGSVLMWSGFLSYYLLMVNLSFMACKMGIVGIPT